MGWYQAKGSKFQLCKISKSNSIVYYLQIIVHNVYFKFAKNVDLTFSFIITIIIMMIINRMGRHFGGDGYTHA